MSDRTAATAAEVRNWLVSHPKSLARLDASARATVVPNEAGQFPKGRLAPAAFAVFNKGQRKAEYVPGNTHRAVAQAEAAALAARKAAVQAAAKQGVTIGKRGPLPKQYR